MVLISPPSTCYEFIKKSNMPRSQLIVLLQWLECSDTNADELTAFRLVSANGQEGTKPDLVRTDNDLL